MSVMKKGELHSRTQPLFVRPARLSIYLIETIFSDIFGAIAGIGMAQAFDIWSAARVSHRSNDGSIESRGYPRSGFIQRGNDGDVYKRHKPRHGGWEQCRKSTSHANRSLPVSARIHRNILRDLRSRLLQRHNRQVGEHSRILQCLSVQRSRRELWDHQIGTGQMSLSGRLYRAVLPGYR